MTGWGVFILVAALFLGLAKGVKPSQRYKIAIAVVFVAVLYAAVRQHTY